MPNKKPQEIVIPAQKISYIDVYVGGDLLVTHRFSEKARKMMLDAQMGIARDKKEKRDPHAEYVASKYIDRDKGWEGLPCAAFRRAIIDAASFVDGITKVQIRGAIFVEKVGMTKDGFQILPIKAESEYMREDVVRLPNGSADLRFRACYENWGAKLKLKVGSILTPEQVHHLVERAGFSIGICEARPQKSGDWGQFNIITKEQYESIGRKSRKAAA